MERDPGWDYFGWIDIMFATLDLHYNLDWVTLFLLRFCLNGTIDSFEPELLYVDEISHALKFPRMWSLMHFRITSDSLWICIKIFSRIRSIRLRFVRTAIMRSATLGRVFAMQIEILCGCKKCAKNGRNHIEEGTIIVSQKVFLMVPHPSRRTESIFEFHNFR